MTSPSTDAAGRDIVERLKSEAPAWAIIGPQLIQPAIDEIQSLRAQLAEKEKDEGQLVDKYTYQVSSLNESLLAAETKISNLKQQLEAIRKQTVEECAKIANDEGDNSSDADSPYDNGSGSCGYRQACSVIEEKIRVLSPTTAEEESGNG